MALTTMARGHFGSFCVRPAAQFGRPRHIPGAGGHVSGWVVEKPAVTGFANKHPARDPESGEERFQVRLDPDENVRAEIRASLSGPEDEPDRRLEVLLQEQVKVGHHD